MGFISRICRSRSSQGACADGYRASRCPRRFSAVNRFIKCVLCLFVSYQRRQILLEGHVITFLPDSRQWTHLPGSSAPSASPHLHCYSSRCTFVCVVETGPLSSTIKIFEAIDHNLRRCNKPTFRKLLQGGNTCLPVQSSSINFLRTKLRGACVSGFEIICPGTPDTQGLLDLSDKSLDYVRRRSGHTHPKPVAIYCLENKFLLCYDGACCVS
jgi:hypothetical protein